ncbi:ABC transporter ATP-binding protein [Microlunatus sp. Y2014]|uniref:ABC transporter ATP-binding protein n=1 Tax=Microlunatus sp. Y2014 TaxID=3418488 RepID=UPI003DA708D7
MARGPFLVAVVTSVLGAGVSIAAPILAGQAVGGLPGLIAGGPSRGFTSVVVALLVVLLLGNVLGVVANSTQRLIGGLVQKDTELRIGHALSADPDLRTLDDPAVAAQVTKVRARGWEVVMGLQLAAGPLLTSVITVAGSAITLAVLLAWWAPIPLLLMYVVEAERFRRTVTAQMDLWTGQVEDQKHARYAFKLGMGEAAKEIRIFGLAEHLRDRYTTRMEAAHRPYWAKRRQQIAANSMINTLRVAVTVAVLGYAGWLAGNGSLGLAALTTCLPVIISLGGADAWMFGQLQRAGEETRWVYDLVEGSDYPGAEALAEPEILTRDRVEESVPDVGPRPVEVVFDDVSFHYPRQDALVLDGLTLTLPAGEATALVGVNGAGKSTLVKLLSGGYPPTRGTVWADGVDLATLDPDQLRSWQRRVAPITQDFVRFPLSAGDNVELGAGRVWLGRLTSDGRPDTAELDHIARRAGIGDLVDGLSDGWATVLDKTVPGGTDLSGGEWQRIALARALRAVDAGAGVLVLDEPAAALDVESEARLVGGYLELANHVTSLVISHRFSVVRPVPRICVLADGRIVEQGSHAELMELTDGRYRNLFTLQANRYLTDAGADA